MRNDSVREELETKITSGPLSRSKPPEQSVQKPTVATPQVQAPEPRKADPTPSRDAAALQGRGPTVSLRQPAKTSKTLVGFQGRQTALPEWRLQMQNAARQRMGLAPEGANRPQPSATPAVAASTASPQKAAPKARVAAVPQDADPRLAAALGRIQASRHAYSTKAVEPLTAPRPQPAQKNNLRFNVVPPAPLAVPERPAPVLAPPAMPRPFESSSMRIKLDTNKLPKLEEVLPLSPEPQDAPLESIEEQASARVATATFDKFTIESGSAELASDEDAFIEDDYEDLAPLSMRVNAGLFDLIVGVVAAMILFSPFILAGGEWVSVSGGLIFGGVLAIVLFLYTTFSIAFVGKTLGMRLFSLEVIDIEENEYPSMQQAAVSSSVFLLSVICAGIGFIPMLFNPERRAAHDLASGTIVVREF